jgi:acid phosphatase family membrane protein YuiD
MGYGMLVAGLIGWTIAGLLKYPIHRITHKEWDWGLFFSTGGMPSSHSALVSATALAVGLFSGFDTPAFAVAFALAAVVIYDAAGVRRQAGIHAERINMIIDELFKGRAITEDDLKEVLGHTPFEVIAGVGCGWVCALVTWLLWPK